LPERKDKAAEGKKALSRSVGENGEKR